jgi:hypothetical protein
MDKKPNVFPTNTTPTNALPTKEQKEAADERARLAAFEAEKLAATQEIYMNSMVPNEIPIGHADAVEMMRRRTEQQVNAYNQQGIVQDPSLAETPPPRVVSKYEQEVLDIRKKSEEQMRVRDERLVNNSNQTQSYQKQYEEASVKKVETINQNNNQTMQTNNYQTPVQQPITQPQNYGQVGSSIDPYIIELSQPNYNSAFDVIPLPSQGKTYKMKKPNVRVSYMTTADENILTSPNLLQSGEFLEILMNRKILESDLRYKDLLVGDRNAIMLWLRATAYGEMYPVTLFDENDVPFDTELNLNELKTKNLGAEPDAEGLFDFVFPSSKDVIKFKMLTCGDSDIIETKLEQDKENKVPVNNMATYTMEHLIIEVNGNRDRNFIKEYVNTIRIRDGKAFSDYVTSIECGIDMNITVKTPGGGSIETFLPLNLKFFWPNIRV